MRINRLALGVLLSAALLGGACGGGDDDDGGDGDGSPTQTGSTPAGQPGSGDCPLNVAQVSQVLENEMRQIDDVASLCTFEEIEPTGPFGEAITVVVRRSGEAVFDEPGLEEVDVGDEAAWDDLTENIWVRVGDTTIEIQVPGGLGSDRELEPVLVELAEFAAQALE